MLPKQLMFTVGLIDQITKPIAKISQQFGGLASNYQAGTMKMASGVAGIAGSAYALTNALRPAIEMDRVLGEVKSLGVRDSALKELTNTAYDFSLKYGKSATDFVSSSYDIQSAIDGLSDADLSAFTLSSNVLATATKSDAATITNYMGTMYGIFKNQANAIGKSKWVEQVTGMTATAVKMFKTTGDGMSGAFTSIGADATSAGIGINEQMAILGTLQSQMSGSEAGTKYKAFLNGVGKAQDALGLRFEDSRGQMLPMVQILNKIKGKYGETISVAEGMELHKAFGSTQAVGAIKALMADVDGLNGSIDQLGQVKGMEQAEKMAAAMTDQSQRLSQSWFVIRAAFGTAILPVFNQFAGWLANVGRDLVSFTEKHPTLTKYLGYAAVAMLGMVAAGGLLTVMVGASTMAMTAWQATTAIASVVGSGYSAVLTAMQTRLTSFNLITMFGTAKTWRWTKAMNAKNLTVSIFTGSIKKAKMAFIGFNMMTQASGGILPMLGGAIMTATSATWGFVASLAAAAWPITALIGAAVLVYKYWQPIKAFFGGFWDGLTEGFAPVGEVFSALFESFSFLGDIFSWMGEQVGFNSEELASWAEVGKAVGSTIGLVFKGVAAVIQGVIKTITWGIEKVMAFGGAVADLFGFGDSPEVKAQLTHKEAFEMALPANVVPMPSAIAQAATSNVVPFTQPMIPASLANQATQARELTARPDNLIELPALKLERTQAQPSFTNNSNANSTDNSKRFHIENMSMKSDDPAQFFQNMLEMTG